MARPTKQGLDYFPLDVHLDNKFKFIEIKYGLEGFAIVVKIFQNIYSQGYWTEWGEDEQLLFASENRIDFDKVENVVNECIKRGIFDSKIYEEHQVLTSSGIQKRYKEATRRRKDVIVTAAYTLIDDINGNSNGVNVNINPEADGINDNTMNTGSQHDDHKSTQSKVKESKVKERERKEGDSEEPKSLPPAPPALNDLAKIARTYEQKISFNLNQFTHDDFTYWLDTYKNVDLILYAIERTAEKPEFPNGQAKPPKLIEHMLKSWTNGNLRTVDEAKAYEERNTKKPVTSGSKRGSLK